jgi:hypothetical protein
MRNVLPLTIWILASPSPKGLRKSRASETETLGARTSQSVPPSNSIEKLIPRVKIDPMPSNMSSAEMTMAGRHNFGKSMELSP